MPRVMSFPFRLGPDGSIASVEQSSDAEVDELIAVGLLTSPGERIQTPTFGVADPAFAGFELAALRRHVADFGPPVDVELVRVRRAVPGSPADSEEVVVHWRRLDEVPDAREVTP